MICTIIISISYIKFPFIGSEIFDLRNSNLSVSECLHCVVLEEKLRIGLGEVELTELIIELLRSDNEKYPPIYDRVGNPLTDISDIIDISGIVH